MMKKISVSSSALFEDISKFNPLDFSENIYRFETDVGTFWIINDKFFNQIAKENSNEVVFKISEINELAKIEEKEKIFENFSRCLFNKEIKKKIPDAFISKVIKLLN